MRRRDRQVTDPHQIRSILEGSPVCRIALCTDGAPYIVPMNFGYEYPEDGRLSLYFHCAAEGRKLDLLRKNALVGFEIDCNHRLIDGPAACDYTFGYASIVGHGQIQELTNHQDKIHGLSLIMAKFGVETPTFQGGILRRTCVLKLTATKFTAKASEGH